MEEKKKVRCEECKSAFTYIRIKDNEIVCRSCGHIQKIEGEKTDANTI